MPPDDDRTDADLAADVVIADLEAATAAIETAQRRASAARSWAVLLMNDLAWLTGAAQQSGIDIPARITDDLHEAVAWLAGD